MLLTRAYSFKAVLACFRHEHTSPIAPEFLKKFCDRLCKAFRAERSSVFALDESRQCLFLLHGTGLRAEDFKHYTVRVGEGICGAAVLSHEVQNIRNALASTQQDLRIAEASGYYADSIMAAPVDFGGENFGAIEVLGSREAGGFPDELSEWLGAIGLLYGAMMARQRKSRSRTHGNKSTETPQTQSTLVGASAELRQALVTCLKAAECSDPVLIVGESGTGKELAARRIHEASERHAGPMVTVNCAAFSDTLLDSELFGHIAGAFTGATRNRKGLFVAATGGTLFLDEVGDMSPMCQAKTLRAIEQGEVLPVGTEKPVSVNVRIVAATNKDLWVEANAGRFRKDLLYRLCGIEIQMPPLREHPEDIPLLVEHFLREMDRSRAARFYVEDRIFDDALQALMVYDWPGNVRELRQTVRSAYTLGNGHIRLEHLPARIQEFAEAARKTALAASVSTSALASVNAKNFSQFRTQEKELYLHALRSTAYPVTGRWNTSAAARMLGIPRRTFAYRVRQLFSLDQGEWSDSPSSE